MTEQDAPRAKWEEPLIKSGRKWIAEALAAWVEDDHAKVAANAPMEVEQLGKAVLWARNPVLLAILSKDHERSFLTLAGKTPDLTNPKLRTIGLREVLNRLPQDSNSALPVDHGRLSRLVEVRGGAIHVGQADSDTARKVLSDALTLIAWIGPHLGLSAGVLFGIDSEVAAKLLDEKRTVKQREVDRRQAAGAAHFRRLVSTIDADLLGETVEQLQANVHDVLPQLINYVAVGSAHACPACNQEGLLLGDVETNYLVDVEETLDGPVYDVGVDYYLTPDSFYCNVCKLRFRDTEELSIAGLPDVQFKLSSDEVTEELIEFAQAQDKYNNELYNSELLADLNF